MITKKLAKQFRENLRFYRKKNNLNLRQAQEKTKVVHPFIWKLEKGLRVNPSLDTLIKLAKGYKCEITDLIRLNK